MPERPENPQTHESGRGAHALRPPNPPQARTAPAAGRSWPLRPTAPPPRPQRPRGGGGPYWPTKDKRTNPPGVRAAEMWCGGESIIFDRPHLSPDAVIEHRRRRGAAA